MRLRTLIVIAAFLLLVFASTARAGDGKLHGTASWYGPGVGVATQWCTWTLRHQTGCGFLAIQSDQTGLVAYAPVIDWCQCYRGTPQERLVDLQWGVVDALGLDRSQGLYQVTVWIIPDGPAFLPDQVAIPNTAATERGSLTVAALLLALVGVALGGLNEYLARQRQPLVPDAHVATIYLRSGRLVWRRKP